MIIRTRQRRFLFLACFHVVAWGASAYFAHSAYTGDRGLIAKREAKVKIAEVSDRIAEVRAERQAWERRVGQLSGPVVDRDLLDERQRAMLNHAHKNDLVIILEK